MSIMQEGWMVSFMTVAEGTYRMLNQGEVQFLQGDLDESIGISIARRKLARCLRALERSRLSYGTISDIIASS
jgi:hypothetical protein